VDKIVFVKPHLPVTFGARLSELMSEPGFMGCLGLIGLDWLCFAIFLVAGRRIVKQHSCVALLYCIRKSACPFRIFKALFARCFPDKTLCLSALVAQKDSLRKKLNKALQVQVSDTTMLKKEQMTVTK